MAIAEITTSALPVNDTVGAVQLLEHEELVVGAGTVSAAMPPAVLWYCRACKIVDPLALIVIVTEVVVEVRIT